jgi:hypothetical protein
MISRRQLKFTALSLLLAGLSMGNESCEQAQNRKRVLLMDVEVGSLAARPVRLPNGEVVDFPYVANALFYRQVMNNDHFAISNPIPMPGSSSAPASVGLASKAEPGQMSTTDNSGGVYSQADLDVLNTYGMLDQAPASDSHGLSAKVLAAAEVLPACVYESPQYLLGGEVVSFEATSGVGVSIGYGVGGDLPGTVGGKVDFKSSKLEMNVRADYPLTQQIKASADGVSTQKETKFGINFSAGIQLGLDFFFKTPITNVLRGAMDMSLTKLTEDIIKKSDLGTWDDAWETRILYSSKIGDGDTTFGIRGGQRNNIKSGDKFVVRNMEYEWEGAPCTSRLKWSVPAQVEPVAELEAINIGDNVAVLRVTKYNQEIRIQPGAQVKILALKPPPTPTPAPKK